MRSVCERSVGVRTGGEVRGLVPLLVCYSSLSVVKCHKRRQHSESERECKDHSPRLSFAELHHSGNTCIECREEKQC